MDVMFAGKFLARNPQAVLSAYFKDVFFAKLGFSVVLPECIALLGRTVSHILRIRSEPQMGRIDTGRIVPGRAVVKDVKSGWNWSEMQFPRDAMGAKAFFSSVHILANLTVSVFVFALGPKPALARLVNVLPEAILKGTVKRMARTCAGTESSLIGFLYPARLRLKLIAAQTASRMNEHDLDLQHRFRNCGGGVLQHDRSTYFMSECAASTGRIRA